MINFIDKLLNRPNMYRLMLYFLIGLILVAFILSAFGRLPFLPIALLVSTLVIVSVCIWSNHIFANYFMVTSKKESIYITALILVLILTPGYSFKGIIIFIIAAILAMASKYLLAPYGRHIFNPAAISVVIIALALGQYASWWVGTAEMVPIVILGGILVVRKMRRGNEIWTFVATVLALLIIIFIVRGNSVPQVYVILKSTLFSSAFFFFTFVMFTDPMTSPINKKSQFYFAIAVAIFYVTPQLRFFGVSLVPEFALCFGNIFSYLSILYQQHSLNLQKNVISLN